MTDSTGRRHLAIAPFPHHPRLLPPPASGARSRGNPDTAGPRAAAPLSRVHLHD
ncbi:hypothetical protein ACFV2X_45135 [Streptomyces sp. NPDC059679]|uniref:hypothetical protein n=1 Tax=Streptomyces sp. NPDC059679 TaxID=3346903 RepID=UPI0036AA3875